MGVVQFPKQFKLLTYPELEALPDPEWLIDSIMQVDSQVTLYGPSGEGKSFVALSMALTIATGLTWLGHQVKKGPVIYVAAEGGRGIRKRVTAWMKHHGV